MTVAIDVLNEAERWLGAHEQPPGSNYVPGVTDWYYGSRPGQNTGAWCAVFVSKVFWNAGMPLPASTPKGFSWVSAGFDWFRKQGWHMFTDWRQAEPGDLIAWEWGQTAGGFDHISIVKTRQPFVTIGGNERDMVKQEFFGAPGGAALFARPPWKGNSDPVHQPGQHKETDMLSFVNTDGREEIIGLSPDGTLVSSWESTPGGGLGPFTPILPGNAPKFSGITGTKTRPTDGRIAVRLAGPMGVPYGAWQNGPSGSWQWFTLAEIRTLATR